MSRANRGRLLLIGESWHTYTIHQKGFDTFTSTDYQEGGGQFLAQMSERGWATEYIRNHEVAGRCPTTSKAFGEFDIVVLSDVGSNTFLLGPTTFVKSKVEPNRLCALREYVIAGGGLLMVGGYMSFSGIDGRARYGASPLADVLAVECRTDDDRVELPEGGQPTVVTAGHTALTGVPDLWPVLLGYNQVRPKVDATTLVSLRDDPLLAVRPVGRGRSAAFASDLAPHWAPPAFMDWEGYPALWDAVLVWLLGRG